MITKTDLKRLKDRFMEYTETFKDKDGLIQKNYNLKIIHTYNVCKIIIEIGKSIGLNEADLNISEVIGLFHDLGRFEQFLKYNTFADNKSIDHSMLAVKIINENNLLDKLDEDIKELILKSILNHNKININHEKNKKILLFSKLIRDADKLDIYRIVNDYYDKKNIEKNDAIMLELKDINEYSEDIFNTVMSGNVARYENLKFSNDLKILQLSWIYDINFYYSFKLIKEKKYLTSIYNTLPKAKKIKILFDKIKSYLNEIINIADQECTLN